jgi:hypothetical protein
MHHAKQNSWNLREPQIQTRKGRSIVQVHLDKGIPSGGKARFWAAVASNLNSEYWKDAFPAAPAVADTVEKNWTRMVASRMSELQVETKKRDARKGHVRACVQVNDGEIVSGAGDRDDDDAQLGSVDNVQALPAKQLQ